MQPASNAMVDRLLAVLDLCVEADNAVSLASIRTDCGLPKSTAWRIAEALTKRGLLTRTDAGYLAGTGLIERGTRAVQQSALRAFVLPELVELHRRTSGAVWAVDVSRPSDWVVIAQVYDRAAFLDRYTENWHHDPTDPSILATALGQVGLAGRPADVDELLRRGVPRVTPHTEVGPRRIVSTLERARDERQVIEHGGVWTGWSCIAVPVAGMHSDRPVAVLGVVDRTPRFVDYRVARAAHDTAERLSSQWPTALGVVA